jgi:hypothetical protein
MEQLVLGPFVALALLLGVGAGAVHADPTNHPRADHIVLTCGGQTYTIVGPGSAGLVAGSTAVFIATQFEGIDTYTDPTTGEDVEVPFSFSIGKGNRTGQQDELTTCTFSETFTDPVVGVVNSEVTVTLFATPRSGN